MIQEMPEKPIQATASSAIPHKTSITQNALGHGDDALEAVQYGDIADIGLSEASFARVLRKIDLVLLPIMA
jgi:hypothetical protein